MKASVFFFSIIIAQICFSQPKTTKLDKTSIPGSIRYTGNIAHAIRWTDNTGDNVVILSTTDKTQTQNEPDNSNGSLYAYHFLISGNSNKQTWRVYDFVKDCPVDMILEFVDNTLAVTDLNNDGKAEVWMMYKVSCQGDVSPVTMKLIMYEGNKKFAARGTTRVKVSETEETGGEYAFDDAFKKAPAAFRQYADKLWKEHKTETWGQ